jgi:hypothetical protein
MIEVTNYAAITAGTNIIIVFAKFTNPDGDFRIDTRLITVLQGVYTEFAAGLVDMTIDITSTGTSTNTA